MTVSWIKVRAFICADDETSPMAIIGAHGDPVWIRANQVQVVDDEEDGDGNHMALLEGGLCVLIHERELRTAGLNLRPEPQPGDFEKARGQEAQGPKLDLWHIQ